MKHYTDIPHYHYLTFLCYKHSDLFLDASLYSLFIKHLDRAHKRRLFKLFGYMVMPDHVHLLIFPEKDISIPAILKAVKQPFSHNALNHLRDFYPDVHCELFKTKGSRILRVFWQAGGGYDRNIFSKKAYLSTLEYMHLNPVRKQLVKSYLDWKWSSARYYSEGIADPIEIDAPEWW